MSYPLAVLAPSIGARSETFIRRHMDDLVPGGAAVVTDVEADRGRPAWRPRGPTLLLRPKRGVLRRGVNAAARAASLQQPLHAALARRFLARHGSRVILAEFLDYGVRWIDLAARLGVPLYAHAHGRDVSALLREERWRRAYVSFNDAAGVVTMSQVSRARLAALGLDASRIHVIPYGVEVPGERPARPGDGATVRCLAVGRMVAKKAPLVLLDSFRRAAAACPALRLDYVGDGPLLDAARDLVERHSLGDRVTLHGGQGHDVVKRLLAGADVFVQHSVVDPATGDEEGLPVSILEAMAAGLPVLATRHAGIPEAVLEGETGYLVAEGDAVGAGDRLATLGADGALRDRMGAAGWRRAAERFTWERERDALRRLLGLG